MPKNSPLTGRLVLNRETVRSLIGTKVPGPVAVTTGGPTEVFTYCNCYTMEPRYCDVA